MTARHAEEQSAHVNLRFSLRQNQVARLVVAQGGSDGRQDTRKTVCFHRDGAQAINAEAAVSSEPHRSRG